MREIVFGASFAVLAAAAVIGIAAWPTPGRPVAAFFPSEIGSAEALRAVATADGRILAQLASGTTTISIGNGPDYVGSLYAAGAWLVIDAQLASLCLKLGAGMRS